MGTSGEVFLQLFLLQVACLGKGNTLSSLLVKSESESVSRSVVSNSLWLHGLYSPWNSPDQNTGVDSHSLFLGLFSTQGLNPGLPHCRWILYQLSHKGSPRILEWVVYPFSSRSSQTRNQTVVSSIAGGFFTNWAIRETSSQQMQKNLLKKFNTHFFQKSWFQFVLPPAQHFSLCALHIS